jgi:hypothetical protein
VWIDGPLSIGAKATNGQWPCLKKIKRPLAI